MSQEPTEPHRSTVNSDIEEYFREVAAAWGDMTRFAQINQKYALEMRFESVPDLCQRFGLTFPAL